MNGKFAGKGKGYPSIMQFFSICCYNCMISKTDMANRGFLLRYVIFCIPFLKNNYVLCLSLWQKN